MMSFLGSLSLWCVVVAMALVAGAAGGCASRVAAGEAAGLRPGEAQYVFVVLMTGPKSAEKTAEQKQKIFAGHMANMRRLSEEKKLIIAGPFVNAADARRRGVFVMDVESVEESRQLAGTDPGVIEGVFTTELRLMKGSAELRRALALEKEMEAKQKEAGVTRAAGEPPANVRDYVIVIAAEAGRVRGVINAAGLGVVWSGEFNDGAGGGVFVVDAADAAAVRAALPMEKTGECSVDRWMSTTSLMGLMKAG
jgi:uncharacterized protein YciI